MFDYYFIVNGQITLNCSCSLIHCKVAIDTQSNLSRHILGQTCTANLSIDTTALSLGYTHRNCMHPSCHIGISNFYHLKLNSFA